ncbi:hypothetical protein OPQ81_007626 [Rhizoctonia solani]|nr:hypothetical protein OPQ81_007626 [Rhizoctonia solani]
MLQRGSISFIMLDNDAIIELVRRLDSPTHGAPTSQLQLTAMQDVGLLDLTQLNSDTLTQGGVATLADTLERLKLDAEAIQSIQQRLESRIKNAQKLFHYATAMLAPINRFPAEVLARIFVLGKRLELNFSPRMSWVAQRWRNVALSTPELWNTIPLTGVGRVTTYVARSGSMLLDIEADLRTYRINTFDIKQCMEVLEPHRGRWHNVKILLEDHDQAQPILRQLEGICNDVHQKASPVSLDSIYFGVASGHDSISSHHKSSLNMLTIPSLAVVELLAVDLFCASNNSTNGFTNLVRLSLANTEHMQLDADLFRPLYAMPNLAELVLDQCSFTVPQLINEPTPIPLEKLTLIQLSLIPDEVVNLIVTRLFAPNLRHFELIAHEMDGPSQILNWEMIGAKYTGLTVLKLDAITSSATHPLVRWLPGLSQLRVLKICFRERLSPKNAQQSSEKILKSLADTRNQHCMKLHTIDIGVLGLGGITTLKGVLQSRPPLRSGKVTVVLGPDVRGKESLSRDIAWMQSQIKRFKIRDEDDGEDHETGSEESDYE